MQLQSAVIARDKHFAGKVLSVNEKARECIRPILWRRP